MNLLSRKIEEVQYAGDVAFTPDASDLSLAAQVSGPNDGLAVSSGWFAANRRVSVVYPDGRRITRAFDGLDRITEIGSVRNATSELVAEYRYLGPWRVLEREYGNGTILSYRQGNTQTGYDEGRRIVAHRHFDPTGDLLAGFAYGYDREDNRLFEEREHAPNTRRGDNWTYDSAYRLTSQERDVAATAIGNPGLTTGIEARDWTLDGVGNWSELAVTPETGPTDTLTQSINEMNEYDAFGGVAQTHDANGNLTDTGELEIEYDHLNRVRRVTRKLDSTVLSEMTYDGAGRRVTHDFREALLEFVERHYGEDETDPGYVPSADLNASGAIDIGDIIASQQQGVLTYYYDGPRVVEERTSAGKVLHQYVDGNGLDEHLTYERDTDGDGEIDRVLFVHENSQGWVYALTDVTGTVVERVTYDAYGAPRFEDEASVPHADQIGSYVSNPYLYTGRRYDFGTRFYYYRHRYYRPETGRFVSRDPLGYAGGSMGLYEYVGGNAVNRGDGWGLGRRSAREAIERHERDTAEKEGIAWIFYATVGRIVTGVVALDALITVEPRRDESESTAVPPSVGASGTEPAATAGQIDPAANPPGAGAGGVAHPLEDPDIESVESADWIKETSWEGMQKAATAAEWFVSVTVPMPPVYLGLRGCTSTKLFAKIGGKIGQFMYRRDVTRKLASRLQFTETAAGHMANPDRWVPRHILAEVIRGGIRSADPQGAAGAVRATATMYRNRMVMREVEGCMMQVSEMTEYTLEVVFRESDMTVLHFLYSR